MPGQGPVGVAAAALGGAVLAVDAGSDRAVGVVVFGAAADGAEEIIGTGAPAEVRDGGPVVTEGIAGAGAALLAGGAWDDWGAGVAGGAWGTASWTDAGLTNQHQPAGALFSCSPMP